MYLHTEEVKQRLDALNHLRIDRAMSVMKPPLKRIYSLLATFLHYHHPQIPGYIDGAIPYGISGYIPDQTQRHYLRSLNLSDAEIDGMAQVEPPILGVYSMGSTSSIGQSCTSDLDIWVCYHSRLDKRERAALQAKGNKLEQWATSMGADISFFMIDENRFRRHQLGNMDGDDCGSTQHILLLDEFYRTAVRLAGRRLLWYMVPPEQEAHYDQMISDGYARHTLVADEWLDLGSLNVHSAEEYFGASLWQLYKSIDSPYKAVLKTLLLEAYSWEYPQTRLLSMEMKQYLHQGEQCSHDVDAYCLMLNKVTNYLIEINDFTRLDMARRCFYLKVCEKLSCQRVCVPWRREILCQLVAEWGWSQQRIEMLDNRANWKIEQVREAHNELLDAMMHSYRNLLRFARRNNLVASASPQDIGVLTRKLYAAFEVLPGKVSLINPQISPDLSESHLTFIHVPTGRVNRAGWYLYNRAPNVDAIIGYQPLEYNRYLNKLVAWAYFNGLLTSKTQLHIRHAEGFELSKLKKLVNDITSHFSTRSPASTAEELNKPCEIRQLAIIVNLEKDPTNLLNDQVMQCDFHQMNVFSFGEWNNCLVGSLDLLYRNSWNEIRTLHFSGELAVLDALKTILGKMHQDAAPPESMQVFCYSRQLRGLLQSCVQQLVAECIDLRLSSSRIESRRFKALRVAGQTWGLFFERLSVSVQKLENAVEFYGAISHNKLHGLPVTVEAGQAHLPPVVDGFASEGIIQFFFKDSSRGFTIYILDEANRVEVYHHCAGDKEQVVRDVSRFYASAQSRSASDSLFGNFNLPQFYQIVVQDGQMLVLPFHSNPSSEFHPPLVSVENQQIADC